MARFRCLDCGCECEGEDLCTERESRGEFWGVPCYETFCVCPNCRSDQLEEIEEDDDVDE